MKHSSLRALIIFCLLISFGIAYGQLSKKLSYNGMLTTTSNQLVKDGKYTLQFSLYDAQTEGKPLWTEVQKDVEVENGTFSVLLGSVSPLDISFNKPLYVEMTAVSGPELKEAQVFSPRTELTSSPFSLAPWETKGKDISFSGGKVGVGTDKPTEQFDVNGTVKAKSFVGDGSNLTGITGGTGGVSNTGSTTIAADNDKDGKGEIALQTNGQTRMTVDNGGNIGIGTKTPREKLEVDGNIRVTGEIHSGNSLILDGSNHTLIATEVIGQPNISRKLRIGTSNPSIENDFKNVQVGIGELDPTERLDINGNIKIQALPDGNNSSLNNILVIDPVTKVLHTRDANSFPAGENHWVHETPSSKKHLLYPKHYNETNFEYDRVAIGINSTDYPLRVFEKQNGDTRIQLENPNNGVAASTQFRMISGGGTTSPSYLSVRQFSQGWTGNYFTGVAHKNLSLIEAGDSSSNLLFHSAKQNSNLIFATNYSEKMRITSKGTVGIGTNSPNAKATLHVEGKIMIKDGTQGDGYVLTSDVDGLAKWKESRSGGVSGTGTTNYVTKWENTTGKLKDSKIFDNGTNVGIGLGANPAPNSKLVIKGGGSTFSTSALNVTNSSNTSSLFVRDDGRVGIGTSAPLQTLDVYGYALVRDHLDPGVVALKDLKGIEIQSTNSSNTNGEAIALGLHNKSAKDGAGAVSLAFGLSSANTIGAKIKSKRINDHEVNLSFFTFQNSLQERLTISSDGNVGINTSAPRQTLDVYGNVLVRDNDANNVEAFDGLKGIEIRSTNSSTTNGEAIALALRNKDAQDGTGAVSLAFGLSSAMTIGAKIKSKRINDHEFNLSFFTFQNSSLQERMTISSEGKVGIGTGSSIISDSRVKLQVAGDVKVGSSNTSPTIRSGSAVPNGTIIGNPGDLYLCTCGQLWFKASGTGTNSGWIQK